MTVKSSRTHVLPIEKVPLAFSLALCIRTRPDFRTAIIMTRAFFLSWGESRGGGVEGYAASSSIRICVMYDSDTKCKSALSIRGRSFESLTRSIWLLFAKTGLDNPPFFILELLSSTHLRPRVTAIGRYRLGEPADRRNCTGIALILHRPCTGPHWSSIGRTARALRWVGDIHGWQ